MAKNGGKGSKPSDDLSDKILRELWALYNDPSSINQALGHVGLQAISRSVTATDDHALLTPRRRITVMIIGNHSAGKSTFINWYTQTKAMKTSVAVETQGFTIVRPGTKLQHTQGDAALVDNPHLARVAERLGSDRKAFMDGLTLLTVPSRAHDFGNVDIIDTPGLVDGHLSYGMDVNRAIVELATICDLVLVFLDPIGQALVARTMNVVQELNKREPEKLRYYLTKTDTVSNIHDRMKVMAQISSQLAGRLSITHGLEIPCIWIPHSKDGAGMDVDGVMPSDDANALPGLVDLISHTVEVRVQKNLDTAVQHCNDLLHRTDQELKAQAQKQGVRDSLFTYLLLLFPFFIILGLASFLDVLLAARPWVPAKVLAAPWYRAVEEAASSPVQAMRDGLAMVGVHALRQRLLVLLGFFFLLALVNALLRCRVRSLGLASREALSTLRQHEAKVEAMLRRATELRQELVRAAEVPDYAVAAK